jgi:hypothetical protein
VPVQAWDDMKEKMKKPFTNWLQQVIENETMSYKHNIVVGFRQLQDGNGMNLGKRMTIILNLFFVRKLQSLDYH